MTAPALELMPPEAVAGLGAELEVRTSAIIADAAANAIGDWSGLDVALQDRRNLGAAMKQVEAFFDPVIGMAYKLHRALCDRKNAVLIPLQRLDRAKSAAIAEFKAEQDRITRERERELAEARRRDEQTQAAATAAALESDGETALAAAVLEEAIAAPLPVVVLPDATKAAGAKFRRYWRWRFTVDEARALQLLPREYLAVDHKKLNAYAEAHKGSAALPGVQVYYEDVPIR